MGSVHIVARGRALLLFMAQLNFFWGGAKGSYCAHFSAACSFHLTISLCLSLSLLCVLFFLRNYMRPHCTDVSPHQRCSNVPVQMDRAHGWGLADPGPGSCWRDVSLCARSLWHAVSPHPCGEGAADPCPPCSRPSPSVTTGTPPAPGATGSATACLSFT